jgi:hypothetical protein
MMVANPQKLIYFNTDDPSMENKKVGIFAKNAAFTL